MNKDTRYKGFTLIEILVVISIIGILSAIVYASFEDARNSAKNRAFQVEMKEVQLAIALYKAQNGDFPSSLVDLPNCKYENICDLVTGDCLFGGTARTDQCSTGGDIIVGLVPDFISSLPDPRKSANPNCVLEYQVVDTLGYKLTAENCHVGADSTEGVPLDSEFSRCPSSCSTCGGEGVDDVPDNSPAFYNSYAVYSNLGQCS